MIFTVEQPRSNGSMKRRVINMIVITCALLHLLLSAASLGYLFLSDNSLPYLALFFSLSIANWLLVFSLLIVENVPSSFPLISLSSFLSCKTSSFPSKQKKVGKWGTTYQIFIYTSFLFSIIELVYFSIKLKQAEEPLGEFELIMTSLFFSRFGLLLLLSISFFLLSFEKTFGYEVERNVSILLLQKDPKPKQFSHGLRAYPRRCLRCPTVLKDLHFGTLLARCERHISYS